MSKIKIPIEYVNDDPKLIRHSDEMQDIIAAAPSTLVKWGMPLFLFVFVMIIGLAAFIHFPEVVKTTVKINNNLAVEMLVPRATAAKVQIGQVVIINFKSNLLGPNKTFKGKIANIEDKPDSSGYLTAHIAIENQRNSSYLKSGMRGDARVIINDFSILKRIFRNFFPQY